MTRHERRAWCPPPEEAAAAASFSPWRTASPRAHRACRRTASAALLVDDAAVDETSACPVAVALKVSAALPEPPLNGGASIDGRHGIEVLRS